MIHLKKWFLLYSVLSATALALVAVLALSPGASPVAGEPDYQGPNRPWSQGDIDEFALPAQAYTRNGSCFDGSYCAVASSGKTQEYDEFRFELPTYATIEGVEVQIGGAAGITADNVKIKLLDAAGDPQNDQKIASLPTSPTYNEPTVGGPTDLWGWGANLTPAIVNGDDFGVEIKNDGTNNSFTLDYVTIKVYLLDTDGDGVLDGLDNCPTVSNPDQQNTDEELGDAGAKYNGTPIGDDDGDVCDADDDDDLFGDTLEQDLGTNPLDNCYGEPGGGDWGPDLDAWPVDFNTDTVITQSDANHYNYTGQFGKDADIPIRQRLDLNGNTTIDIGDANAVSLKGNHTCD